MTTSLLALLLAPAGLAVLVAAALWRRRQQRRLLNSRETAHLLRQAHYLLQLGHTVLQCDIDPDIARALLGLAEETLDHLAATGQDRKSTRLNSSHVAISYAVFCLKKKKISFLPELYLVS